MALRESSRLCASLLKEKVPVRRLVVNQLLPQSASDCKFCAMKTKVKFAVTNNTFWCFLDLELVKIRVNVSIRESVAIAVRFFICCLQDQNRVLDMIPKDPELAKLALIRSHLMDVEIRGIPALKFMGDMVWRWFLAFKRLLIQVTFGMPLNRSYLF